MTKLDPKPRRMTAADKLDDNKCPHCGKVFEASEPLKLKLNYLTHLYIQHRIRGS